MRVSTEGVSGVSTGESVWIEQLVQMTWNLCISMEFVYLQQDQFWLCIGQMKGEVLFYAKVTVFCSWKAQWMWNCVAMNLNPWTLLSSAPLLQCILFEIPPLYPIYGCFVGDLAFFPSNPCLYIFLLNIKDSEESKATELFYHVVA